MIVIRNTQLARMGLGNVKQRLRSHLQRVFPTEFAVLDTQKTIDQTIDHGVKRAQDNGFNCDRDMCKYLDLMFVFGRDFDVEQSWAQAVLREKGIGPDVSVMECLFHVAKQHVKEAKGIISSRVEAGNNDG